MVANSLLEVWLAKHAAHLQRNVERNFGDGEAHSVQVARLADELHQVTVEVDEHFARRMCAIAGCCSLQNGRLSV
jgi:hypothetical protein